MYLTSRNSSSPEVPCSLPRPLCFSPPNGAIDIGERVTVEFRLRNIGNVPSANLVATLLSGGGVSSPSPATTNYGVLLPGGDAVARAFSFTAGGTNGGSG